MDIRPAAERFAVEHDGIASWHCFSAGAYYDPANTGFATMIGCDEHRVAPGAGFARHAHRGVEIVSVVLSGVLQHQADGATLLVGAGEILWQSAGTGLEHVEANGGDEQLRFVQTTWLSERTRPEWSVRACSVAVAVGVGGGEFGVRSGPVRTDGPAHCYVADGSFELAGSGLTEGACVRADEPISIAGTGRLLVWHRPA